MSVMRFLISISPYQPNRNVMDGVNQKNSHPRLEVIEIGAWLHDRRARLFLCPKCPYLSVLEATVFRRPRTSHQNEYHFAYHSIQFAFRTRFLSLSTKCRQRIVAGVAKHTGKARLVVPMGRLEVPLIAHTTTAQSTPPKPPDRFASLAGCRCGRCAKTNNLELSTQTTWNGSIYSMAPPNTSTHCIWERVDLCGHVCVVHNSINTEVCGDDDDYHTEYVWYNMQ